MEETKLTDENEYEKRYERGVIVFDSFAASNLRLIEVEDWFNWLQEGWLVFLEKKCDILYLYRESCFFLSLNVICLMWKLFVHVI